MSDEAAAHGMNEPGRTTEKTRLTSVRLRADVIRVAEQVARTQDRLAETLARLACQHPYEAARLRAKITVAETGAARTRRLASDLQGDSPARDDSTA
jgi:hypothetical protein